MHDPKICAWLLSEPFQKTRNKAGGSVSAVLIVINRISLGNLMEALLHIGLMLCRLVVRRM